MLNKIYSQLHLSRHKKEESRISCCWLRKDLAYKMSKSYHCQPRCWLAYFLIRKQLSSLKRSKTNIMICSLRLLNLIRHLVKILLRLYTMLHNTWKVILSTILWNVLKVILLKTLIQLLSKVCSKGLTSQTFLCHLTLWSLSGKCLKTFQTTNKRKTNS